MSALEPIYTSAVVITVSDRASAGLAEDLAGPAVASFLEDHGYQVQAIHIVPDGIEQLSQLLINVAAQDVALCVTTGGTGFSPRDLTPEATQAVAERLCPGIGEAMRAASMAITPRGCLSRAIAAIRQQTLIVNVPGSPKAAIQNLDAVIEALGHGLRMLRGPKANCAEETAIS